MDVLFTDPVSGRPTGLARTVRRALEAMERSGVPYCVVGATALAVRGLPRMTRDLDLLEEFSRRVREARHPAPAPPRPAPRRRRS